jgi:hypothetical protein
MPTDFSFEIIGGTFVANGEGGASTITRCLKVDPTTGDLVHDGHRLQLIADVPAIAQSLRTRLSTFQGEWFLDEDFGVPYFQTVLGKQASLVAVREVFRGIIADTPGVLGIVRLELGRTRGGGARDFTLSFAVTTDTGQLSLTLPVGAGV